MPDMKKEHSSRGWSARVHTGNRCRIAPVPRPGGLILRTVTVVGMLLLMAGCATTKPVALRGPIHHIKSIPISKRVYFEVQPMVATDGIFRLRFVRYEESESRQIEYYEKVMEYQVQGEMDPTKIRRITVPGEFIEVQGEVQHQRKEVGLLAREKIKVNDVEVTLTAPGIFEDRAGLVLRFFDDMELGENTGMTLRLQHPELGEQSIVLTRRQLMEYLGIAWDAPAGSANNGLAATVTASATTLKPGAELTLTLAAENRGTQAVAKVIGRTFSRCDWLNGRNFYLGTLKPGEKRVAVRTFQVPAAGAGDNAAVFAELALWDINKGDRMGEEVVRNFPLTFHLLPVARSP